MDDMIMPQVNQAKMGRLGVTLRDKYEQYKKDKREVEQQWLRNLRQFKGILDPEIAKLIPADQSTAYPKITRTKVIGTVARLMEMLFPATEKNWGIQPSPLPTLSQSDLQIVLDGLENPTNDQIEKAIFDFARVKSERMAKEIDDQLEELDYLTLARRIVFSSVQYSLGILKGPMVKRREGRTWTKDPMNGTLKATTVEKMIPAYEFTSVWDWYPDLSAKEFEQMDGSFQRHVMSRNQVAELAKRPDFNGDAIKQWLQLNSQGNYKELYWEIELRVKADRKNLTDLSGRKYELWEWWGCVSGHDLKACGVNVPDNQLDMEVEANIWGIGATLIKSKLNPYNENIRPYHKFVYEEDEINLTGSGLPQVVRDSQMAIGEASRMLLDNASVVCGDMVEINTDLLLPGQTLDIYARKAWLRTGTGAEASLQAVRAIPLESHIGELTGIINLFREFADTETALPPPALGDPSRGGSEALRTTGGMSMLMGAAALPIRDTVRNFDKFTVSFITSLYYWNREFNPNPDADGDYQVIARGSTSLIAKEVRATALDQFSVALTDEERAHVKTRQLLEERMKSHDIPLDVLDDIEVVKQRLAEQAQQAQTAQAGQERMLDAEVKKLITAAFKDVAQALAAQAGINVNTFEAITKGINDVNKSELERSQVGSVSSAGRSSAKGAVAASGG